MRIRVIIVKIGKEGKTAMIERILMIEMIWRCNLMTKKSVEIVVINIEGAIAAKKNIKKVERKKIKRRKRGEIRVKRGNLSHHYDYTEQLL
jgi:hypothetical protein